MSHWKKNIAAFILCLPAVLWAQEPSRDLAQLLQEARVLNEALRAENLRLQREVTARDEELRQLRSRYAALLVDTDRRAAELTGLELAAAHLLRGEGEFKPAEGNASELLEVLALTRRRMLAFSQTFADHETRIGAILDACSPSDALRQQAQDSFRLLRKGVENCLQPLTLATAPAATANSGSCAILLCDPATAIVILDRGFLNGVRVGSDFILRQAGQVAARLKVVDCRPLHAAAIVSEGDFKKLVPGTLLHREQTPAAK